MPVKQEKTSKSTDVICISSSDEASLERHEKEFMCISSSSSEESLYDVRFNKQQMFLNKNENLPIYSTTLVGLDSANLISLCFGESDCICIEKPVSVRQNAVFVIDLNKVSKKSLCADDNGVWETSCPRRYYKVNLENGKVGSVAVGNHTDYTHMMQRQYGRHKATYELNGSVFQRIITTVKSRSGTECKFAVVQYLLKNCNESDIAMAPHGNSTGERKYYRSDPTVLDKIKEMTETKPKKTFRTLLNVGDDSPSCTPRNYKQIYNVNWGLKRKIKEERETDFGYLFAQIKENDFARNFSMTADCIQYVLVSDKQLNDLESFCTKVEFSVLSIDSTFDVGEFFVTNTCYANLRLVHSDGKYRGRHPLAHGPSFIHNKLDTNAYVTFLASLTRMRPSLKGIKAIGTDGDESILNATLICFPETIQLICCDHKKENVEHKLCEFKVSEAARRHIVADIFGRNVGASYEQGLIDCESIDDFDRRVKDFKGTWDYLVPGFHTCFIRYQSDLFKLYLIREVCRKANINGRFSNNRIESMNDNIKDWVERKKMSMPAVNDKIRELIEGQQQEFEMAVFGSGQYDLSENYNHIKKERHEWNAMNKSERELSLQNFWKSTSKTPIASTASTVSSINSPEHNTTECQVRSEQLFGVRSRQHLTGLVCAIRSEI